MESNTDSRFHDSGVTADSKYDVLEASTVYLLMSNQYRISRNRRAEWFFTHLDSIIHVPYEFSLDDAVQELEIISVIPRTKPPNWCPKTAHLFQYKVNCETVVTFLSRKYRIVYCLDVSPSVASVDVQSGVVMIDDIFAALKNSTEALMMPFYVPGSRFLFHPKIYITVIAHGSFLSSTVDQVLIQGIALDPCTYKDVITMLFHKLHELETLVADITTYIQEILSKKASERKGDEPEDNMALATAMSPDFGLVDLLRQAFIALNLLPDNSTAGLIIMTDGVISVPDGGYLDMVLSQLRYNTVSCSFVQLSSPFHPHVCYGVIPYADLIRFISSATFGAYLTTVPKIEGEFGELNPYHETFLTWTFQKLSNSIEKPNPFAPTSARPGEWSVKNKCFTSVRDMPIDKKLQFETTLSADYMKVLSSRLREGFVVKEVIQTADNKVHIVLSLAWKFLIKVEYILCTSLPAQPKVDCSVSIEGPYDFLHDVTCLARKQFNSYYRQLLVNRFWAAQKHLSESDKLLVHFNSFSTSPLYYTIPDSLKNGVPLFCIASNTSVPVLQPSEFAHHSFAQFWKPVCLLDTSIWQKWMHTHRIGLILEHDHILPKHLHIPNSSGRYHVIQCRQTVMALNTLLRDWSSFVLVENHSYIKLMFNDNEKPPFSFCIIRITTKPPLMVLRLAFLVGTPGHLRNQAVTSLREKIAAVTFPQRLTDPPKWRVNWNAGTDPSSRTLKKTWSDMPGCILLQKPVEKILIRYDLPPRNFFRTLVPQHPYNTWASSKKSSANQSTFGFRPTYSTPWGSHADMGPEMFNTLARYLYHLRWIWCVRNDSRNNPSMDCAALILSTLTKMRLQSGLRFTFSSGGVINMVKELKMGSTDEYVAKGRADVHNETSHCVLQYVLFPPVSSLICSTEEEEDPEEERPEFYLVTECWIEPQCGKVLGDWDQTGLENLRYSDIPEKIFESDQECITTLLTFEHLSLMCQDRDDSEQTGVPKSNVKFVKNGEEQIQYIPFKFELSRILPKSRQAEMLFSMLNQDLSISFPVPLLRNNLDRVNVKLFNCWCLCVADLHDREIILDSAENKNIYNHIVARKRDSSAYAAPIEHATQNFNPANAGEFPKWRCFAKWISAAHIIVTIFPASYLDLMTLMLTKSSLEKDNLNQAFQLLSEVYRHPDVETGTRHESVPNNSSASRSPSAHGPPEPKSATVCSGPEGQNYFFANSTALLNERKRSRIKSGGELIHGCGYTKSLIRKSSVDNLFFVKNFAEIPKLNEQGKMKSTSRQLDPEKDCDSVPDSRYTSSIELPNFSESTSSDTHNVSNSSAKTFPSDVYGSVTLPVYVYDCSLSTANDHIIFRTSSGEEDVYIDARTGTGEQKQSIYAATEASFPSHYDGVKSSPKHLSPEPKSDESDLTPSDKEVLRRHCCALEGSFSKAYVLGLFESLQANHFIQPNDVQVAISFCEETKVEIDLSEFIQSLCSHVKDEKLRHFSDGAPSHALCYNYDSCEDLIKTHEFIKARFHQIILSTFYQIKKCPGIYYFKFQANDLKPVKPPPKIESKVTSECEGSAALSPRPDSNQAVLPLPKTENQESSVKEHDSSQLDKPTDQRSNVEASSNVDNVEEVPVPILMYLTCSYKLENSEVSFLVHELPTCIDEIMDALDIQEWTPAWDIGLKLEFVFLTAPKLMESLLIDYNLSMESYSRSVGAYHAKVPDEPKELDKGLDELLGMGEFVPSIQLKYLNQTIDDVKWLIRDEVTSFESEKIPVTENTLCGVVNHIEKSKDKPGCQLTNIPLVFVNNSCSLGYEKFKKRFQAIRSCGYTLMQKGSLYYMMGDKDALQECLGRFPVSKLESHAKEGVDQEREESEQGELEGMQIETPCRKLSGQESTRQKQMSGERSEPDSQFLTTPGQLSERSSLITNEDGYDGDGSESSDDGTKSLTSLRKPKCASFWIIFKLAFQQVSLYFQCRYSENDLEIFQNSIRIRKQIENLIYKLKRLVNQDLLLQQLHDTRQCSALLEPEYDEDYFMENYPMHSSGLPLYEENNETRATERKMSTDNNDTFGPGVFSCRVVWETKFILHPRLRIGPGKSLMSRGIQTIKATLIAFEVTNRRNMFVYQDSSGNNFYFRLYRTDLIQTTVSSPTRLEEPAEVFRKCPTPDSSEDNSIRRESVSERELSNLHLNKNNETIIEDVVLLQVCGITEAGLEIKEHLVQSLRNKLDDSVLDILSVMLDRNPHCKLTPEDVHFIQKPNTHPDSILKYYVNGYAEKYLTSFVHYLNQNLLQFSSAPKYMDSKPENHFHDYPHISPDNETVGKNLYLYNQSPGETGSRGIAFIALAIVDFSGKELSTSNWCRPSNQACSNEYNMEDMLKLIQTEEVGGREPSDADILMEFRMWKQGRINVDLLKSYLSTAIKHAMWDLCVEFYFLTAPIACHDFQPRPPTLGENPLNCGTVVPEGDIPGLFTRFDTGDEGRLHPIYVSDFQQWCEFGTKIHVPSLRMMSVKYHCRQTLDIAAQQIENLIHTVAPELLTKTFWKIKETSHHFTVDSLKAVTEEKRLQKRTLRTQFELLDSSLQRLEIIENRDEIQYPKALLSIFEDPERYDPTEPSYECTIISRHLRNWKACFWNTDGVKFCSDEKSHYKFPPLLSGPGANPISSTRSSFSKPEQGIFSILVPRQRLLIATVTNSQIEYLFYNWSKESSDRLMEISRSHVFWISARASVVSSISSQKSGIFYNQDIFRRHSVPSNSADINPYTCGGMDVESLLGKPMPPKELSSSRMSFKRTRSPKILAQFQNSFRNIKHQAVRLKIPGVINNNVKFLETQVLQLKEMEKTEIQQTLYQNWLAKTQNPPNTINIDAIQSFKQSARIIHFCMTPLLFQHRWRIEVAATRDNAIGTVKKPRFANDSKRSRRFTKTEVERSRHGSGASQKSLESSKKTRTSIWNLWSSVPSPMPSETKSQPHESPLPGVPSKPPEEKWHAVLCDSFMEEYVQYVQTLGYVRLVCKNLPAKKTPGMKIAGGDRIRHISGASLISTGSSQSGGSAHGFASFINLSQQSREYGGVEKAVYLQKILPGGIILFEITLCEPFCCVNIYAIEMERIHPNKFPKETTQQHSSTFLDECEKVKVLMHLHSFTYDFHLRIMQSYICAGQVFTQGYHVTNFLDDFVKYYPKGPNFARNTVHIGIITVQNVSTPSHILYNYILSHEKLYNMKVIRMSTGSDKEANEYILFQESTKKITYKDVDVEKQYDEFDLSLLIAHAAPPLALHYSVDPSVLKLKYYIVLTSRRELYPKVADEKTSGKLCVVNTPSSYSHRRHLNSSKSQLHDSHVRSRRESADDRRLRGSEESDMMLSSLEKEVRDMGINHPYSGKVFYDGIKEEMIHYMGYFSSHEQMMQDILNEQVTWVESQIREFIKLATVDCRRDLLWQRLLVGGKADDKPKYKKEDLIARETVGALSYWEFGELLEHVHVKSLSLMDSRVASLLKQPIAFYQSLLRMITVGNQHSHRYFAAPDQSIHQMAIFSPNVSRSVVMLEINLEKRTADLSVVFKELDEKEDVNKPFGLETEILNLIESVINMCCYCSWANLV